MDIKPVDYNFLCAGYRNWNSLRDLQACDWWFMWHLIWMFYDRSL